MNGSKAGNIQEDLEVAKGQVYIVYRYMSEEVRHTWFDYLQIDCIPPRALIIAESADPRSHTCPG